MSRARIDQAAHKGLTQAGNPQHGGVANGRFPAAASPSLLHQLQQAFGNRQTQTLIQTKSNIGAPNDPYERQANDVAQQLTQHTQPPTAEATMAAVEHQLGANFSQTQLHSDRQAHQLNEQLASRAVTIGQHIYFRQGEFPVTNQRTATLLAHELTHVHQQAVQPALAQTMQRMPIETFKEQAPTVKVNGKRYTLSQLETLISERAQRDVKELNADGLTEKRILKFRQMITKAPATALAIKSLIQHVVRDFRSSQVIEARGNKGVSGFMDRHLPVDDFSTASNEIFNAQHAQNFIQHVGRNPKRRGFTVNKKDQHDPHALVLELEHLTQSTDYTWVEAHPNWGGEGGSSQIFFMERALAEEWKLEMSQAGTHAEQTNVWHKYLGKIFGYSKREIINFISQPRAPRVADPLIIVH